MLKRLFIVPLAAFLLLCQYVNAQEITKMTITDHLAGSVKVSMGKPKPAPAKTHFQLTSQDKGTQVMIFADLVPNTELTNPYVIKFTAYKLIGGKQEHVDDRELPVKNSATYALSAFNFFEEGNYKIVATDQSGKKVLAEGSFTVGK